MDFSEKKIAVVCDWITDRGGAELVVSHILELFPQAVIFTSVFTRQNDPTYAGHSIRQSWIAKIPYLRKKHKLCALLRPWAFERFDLSGFDIVISSSSAESKGVITDPKTLHVCYCHTPTRYYWSHTDAYVKNPGLGAFDGVGRTLLKILLPALRKKDYAMAQRPNAFLANSQTTADRIREYYGRESTIVYPGIDMDAYPLSLGKRKEFYFAIGRIIPYKRFDLLVDAFNASGKQLVIATSTDTELFRELRAKSAANITWIFGCGEEEKIRLYSEARAFLFPAEEDFWLVPVEAMACGTPVIAFGKGGATETVQEGASGLFFDEQTPEKLNAAIECFESLAFDPTTVRSTVEDRLGKRRFQREILERITEEYDKTH